MVGTCDSKRLEVEGGRESNADDDHLKDDENILMLNVVHVDFSLVNGDLWPLRS